MNRVSVCKAICMTLLLFLPLTCNAAPDEFSAFSVAQTAQVFRCVSANDLGTTEFSDYTFLTSPDPVSIYVGWNAICTPYHPANPDPVEVFGGTGLDLSGKLLRWSPSDISWIPYLAEHPELFGPITPGEGYFLFSAESLTMSFSGVPWTPTGEFDFETPRFAGSPLVSGYWDFDDWLGTGDCRILQYSLFAFNPITQSYYTVNSEWSWEFPTSTFIYPYQAFWTGGGAGYGPTIIPDPESATISEAKLMPDDSAVMIQGAVVTAVWNDIFYISSLDRSAGIRVEKTFHGLTEGMIVYVVGSMQTRSDERYIQAPVAVQTGNGTVRPVAMTNKSLGGSDFLDSVTGVGQVGVTGGFGLNNIGLLVTVSGRVIEVESGHIRIDDLSTPNGVRVDAAPLTQLPEMGDFVMVTGISSMGDFLEPLVIPRGDSDVITYSTTD